METAHTFSSISRDSEQDHGREAPLTRPKPTSSLQSAFEMYMAENQP